MESWYWLNENSRGFLARGYLAEGQTAEDRIRVIAEAAENFLKQPDLLIGLLTTCLRVGYP
jgi:ribonucleoside-diphosphate reductase alpha chain